MVTRWPALTIEYHNVVADANARNEVAQLVKKYKVRAVSYPCIQAAGRLVVGFRSDETTGRRIEDLFLQHTQDRREKETAASPTARRAPSTLPFSLTRTHPCPRRFSASRWASLLSDNVIPSQSRYWMMTVPRLSWPLFQLPDARAEPPALDEVSEKVSMNDDVPLPDEVPLIDEAQLTDEFGLPDEVPSPGETSQMSDVHFGHGCGDYPVPPKAAGKRRSLAETGERLRDLAAGRGHVDQSGFTRLARRRVSFNHYAPNRYVLASRVKRG